MITLREHTLQSTVDSMKELIAKHWTDIEQFIPSPVASFDDAFSFVKNIPYKEDKNSPECLYHDECLKAPLRTVQYGGDCDDKVILLSSFAKAFKIPYRIVTVSYPPNNDAQVHTYIEIQQGGSWYPMDATYAKNNPYWEKKPYATKILW